MSSVRHLHPYSCVWWHTILRPPLLVRRRASPPLPTSYHVPQEKVRLSHQRIARALAKVDSKFQEQMSQASATLDGVDRAENGGGWGGGSAASSVVGVAEKNRELAVLAASDSAKVWKRSSWGDACAQCWRAGLLYAGSSS